MSDFKFDIENKIEFNNKITQLGLVLSDFRIPFRLIASDFYKSQKIIFSLKGPGLYNPLGGFNYNNVDKNGKTRRENAEDRKKKKVGFSYPLLVGQNSNIKDSTLGPNHANSIFNLTRSSLEIGTNVKYAGYHQSDEPRTTLPQRKFLFIDGGPKDGSASSGISGRRERWINILDDHIKQIVTGKVL